MPPPFRPRTIEEFAAELEAFDFGSSRLTEVHVHHTYRPDHATYKALGGARCVAGMHRYHTRALGWSDIAQQESIGPGGVIWSGRSWLAAPASSRGHNGSRARHPFMIEMIGDFEIVADGQHDILTPVQRHASVGICALICERFDLVIPEAVKFHRDLHEKWKSCPGDTIDRDEWIADVRAWAPGLSRAAVDLGVGVKPPADATSYTVKPGDSWWSIANKHHVLPASLAHHNGKDIGDVIHPGDVLEIPR